MYALKYTAVGKTLPAPQIIPSIATALPFGFKWGVLYGYHNRKKSSLMYALKYTAVAFLLLAWLFIPPFATPLAFGFKWGCAIWLS